MMGLVGGVGWGDGEESLCSILAETNGHVLENGKQINGK
jgi:hypothetical protein